MRWVVRTLFAVLILLVVAFFAGWLLLAGSLARLDGTLAVAGLADSVKISRDRSGIVTIEAANRKDLSLALGFIHGQERFFQMDIMRRSAAGELADLVGRAALSMDLDRRRHRFRARAEAALAALPGDDRALLDAYRDGVNAGMAALRIRPWEYLLLRARPVEWRSEDSLLVVDAMFLDLNGGGTNERELRLSQMRAALPAAIVDFLMARDGAHEAPLQGAPAPAPAIPGPDALDLRSKPAAARPPALADDPHPGSNNFAVAGPLTGGAALVANDMHLGLGVPNIWFRARLRYQEPPTGQWVDLNGLTLPGMPAMIAGSNGHIAWGFTNSYGDWLDWVRIDRDPDNTDTYRTPDGWEKINTYTETIRIKGAQPRILDIHETRWGPIMGEDADGTPLALAWIAHLPRAFNLNLLRLERTFTVGKALDIAPVIGMPPQNFVVGDSSGNIGWTLTGNALPLRAGFDPSFPADWSQRGTGWVGFAASAQFPRIERPAGNCLWSANNRTTSDAWLALLGDGGYDNGARARQIRDNLLALSHAGPADLLGIQLDDRALFLARWQALLQETLAKTGEPELAHLRNLTSAWAGRAAVGSVDYRLVRSFRQYVREAVLAPFLGRLKSRYPDFRLPPMFDGEAPVWVLVQARPLHLLDPGYADWNALLHAASMRLVDQLGSMPGGLAARTWGERNTAAIRHPLSASLPGFIAHFLDMPADQLPGDSNMPRVQAPAFGASERFVIMPGKEDRSFLHMPGGQSGHALSPYYGAGHRDWVQGRPSPLLPGPAEHRLVLSRMK